MSNNISRLEKLENISGEKYPRDFPGRETISAVLNPEPRYAYPERNEYNERKVLINDQYIIRKIAGRISARRDHGNNIFFDIFDQTGQIQLHAKKLVDGFDPPTWWTAVEEIDIGDMVGVEGTLGANPRGEPLLLISNFITLAKALKAPPANFHGVKNPELKYRHREQDLLSSTETRELFKTRAQIVFEIRKYLNDRDFVEIETPMLQPIYGGATARPFTTKHNSLGQEFYLQISSELYLKRAMVGGFDRVYSFSRCFRNEGISPTHNPEFTNLEIFETCSTGQDMMSFTYQLLDQMFLKYGVKPECLYPLPDGRKCCECKNCQANLGNLYDPHVNLPASEWPLSRKFENNCPSDTNNDGDCGKINCPYCGNLDFRYADAWELYINDMEIASGATDLNDPREQEARLEESEVNAIARSENPDNAEFDPMDKNYIEALEMGALPWAGVGIGIDRLVMLLTGRTNIREVLMFPLLKSEQ